MSWNVMFARQLFAHLWEMGEFCLALSKEVMMSSLGAIASMFQNQGV